ncbi:MAG TPA: hypothetical protein VGM90_33180 [Kofleriaceae bacterium]
MRWVLEAWRKPSTLVVVAALVAAVAFSNVAGTVGELVLCGAAGIGVLHLRERYAGRWNMTPKSAGWIAIGVVLFVAFMTFRPVLFHPTTWAMFDQGPQDAVLSDALSSMKHGKLPHWTHTLVGGDSPLELYPSFTYILAGAITIASGSDANVPVVLLLMAVAAHILIALSATRLALRFLPASLAALIGCALIVDQGSVSSGGVIGTIEYSLLHSAMGQVFALSAVVSVVDCMRRPRIRTSIAIWCFTALSVMSHPSALLSAAVVCLALVAVALLARDVPARRPLFAAGHIVVGTALGAFVWLPLGERLLNYAQHFSSILVSPGRWLLETFNQPVPEGTFAIIVFIGYAGVVAAVWSRRAVTVFIGAIALAFVCGRCDVVYLGFDLAPSPTVARLGSDRFYGLVRPFMYVASAYAMSLVFQQVRQAWKSLSVRDLRIACAIAGVLGGAALRIFSQAGVQLVDDVRLAANAHVGAKVNGPLLGWEYTRMLEQSPERFARAAFYDTLENYLHATARTGLPAVHFGAMPDVMIRHRIEDSSPESLRRFNVRWLVTLNPNFELAGDPKTEIHVGPWKIQEVPGWDGKFARVERGGGEAITHRIDNDAVEIELTKTDKPALVVLGMSYYPRWRAIDANGRIVPVYAYPATEKSSLMVVAAWVRPGLTRFTSDGPLPSDGKGRDLSLLALVGAFAAIAIWTRRAWKHRALVVMSRTLRAARSKLPLAARVGSIVFAVGLIGVGVTRCRAPARSLELGTGALGDANVWVHPLRAKDWQKCGYSTAFGQYQCDLAVVTDTTWTILNDEQPSWMFTTPTIFARSRKFDDFDLRIRMRRHLAGTYWVGSWGNAARIQISGMPDVTTNKQQKVYVEDKGIREITITAAVPATGFHVTFVSEASLIPVRDEPRAPLTPP